MRTSSRSYDSCHGDGSAAYSHTMQRRLYGGMSFPAAIETFHDVAYSPDGRVRSLLWRSAKRRPMVGEGRQAGSNIYWGWQHCIVGGREARSRNIALWVRADMGLSDRWGTRGNQTTRESGCVLSGPTICGSPRWRPTRPMGYRPHEAGRTLSGGRSGRSQLVDNRYGCAWQWLPRFSAMTGERKVCSIIDAATNN